MKILILTNQLLTTCGVSKHLLYFLTEVKKHTEHEFTIISGGGDAIDVYKNICENLVVNPIFNHENRSVVNFLKALLFLRKLQLKNNFQIIHSHNHYLDNLAHLTSYLIKVKTLQTVHGIIEPIGKLKHYPSKHFIAVNEHVFDYLIKQNKKIEGNVRLIRSGVHINSNFIKPSNAKLKIIAAGRLIPEKGFDIFIEAVSRLKKNTLDNAEFLIAGKGDYELELKKLSENLNVNINFIGQVKDLNDQLISTHIFVTASQSEGFPMTIIEAALTKNLIISSNFLGYDAILKDGINSIIFEMDDVNELTSKLEKAISNIATFNHLVDNMFTFAKDEFNSEKMVKETIKYYSDIVK